METKVLPDAKVMYQALVNKDKSFEGIFFAAVKPTGIFCRPSCTASKPKFENVEYFATSKEALDYGYRACKVCQAMEINDATPDWLKTLFQKIDAQPDIRLKDYELRQMQIDPSRLRRWFKKHHGMTFQAYLRMRRINLAFGTIKYGEKNNSPLKVSSNKNNTQQTIYITRILTPLGPMMAGATADGICLLEFTDRRMLETQFKRLEKYLHAQLIPGTSPHFKILQKQIAAYFAGTLKEFDLPLVIPGSDFQKNVWKALQTIPFGSTRSYKEQAVYIGNPKAVRAVGRANGDNRLGIIIPCHRVLGSDGNLTGYGGGLWRKAWMLDHEAVHSSQ